MMKPPRCDISRHQPREEKKKNIQTTPYHDKWLINHFFFFWAPIPKKLSEHGSKEGKKHATQSVFPKNKKKKKLNEGKNEKWVSEIFEGIISMLSNK